MTISLSRNTIKYICKKITTDQLAMIESFVVFLGHAHSGHSLIGALLDSHPKAAITNEVNVAKLIRDHKLNAQEVMSVILNASFENQKPDAWFNTGYSYKTTAGFQGTTTQPLVLGDKKGGGNTRIIRKNPEVLHHLDQLFGKKLKFIQVQRDPRDNIAAFAHYWGEAINMSHVNRYFENLETVQEIEDSGIGQFYKLSYSSFMQDPQNEFLKLLKFLDLNTEQDLLTEILKIVRPKEHKRAKKHNWPTKIEKEIEKRIKLIEKK